MKCPKCKRGKLKFVGHKCVPGTIKAISKCTDSNCTFQISPPSRWEVGETILTYDLDIEKEMVDIISKQIMEDHAEAVGKAIDSIADDLVGKPADEIPVIELEMETSYIGEKNV